MGAGQAPVAINLAVAGQVAQGGVQAAAGKLIAHAVDGEAGVLFCAQLLPDMPGKVVAHAGPGDAPDHPAQRVAVDGFVGKGGSVLALLFHRQQKSVGACRPGVAIPARQHAAGPHLGPDLGLRVSVVFRVLQAGLHVQQLAYAGITKGAGLQLGQVAPQRCVFIQPSAAGSLALASVIALVMAWLTVAAASPLASAGVVLTVGPTAGSGG